jgi:hypothetical protein
MADFQKRFKLTSDFPRAGTFLLEARRNTCHLPRGTAPQPSKPQAVGPSLFSMIFQAPLFGAFESTWLMAWLQVSGVDQGSAVLTMMLGPWCFASLRLDSPTAATAG